VGRAITAELSVLEVFHCPELMGVHEMGAALSGLSDDVPLFTVPAAILKMLAYRDEPEGVIAVVKQPAWTLEGLAGVQQDGLYLVAVGTAKPGNLGAMARSAEAAGCGAVLACGTPVDAFNPNAIRASTCAVFTLPIVNVEEAQAVDWLRGRGLRIAATTPDPDRSTCYTDADLTGPLAIVIGPEDAGLSDAWLDAADVCVSIPTLGQTVDSLNAANAAAIVLFEAVRQRTRCRNDE
jgi:TrmH family RNA methyltransferase